MSVLKVYILFTLSLEREMSRNTLNTDGITIRRVNALTSSNTYIPALTTLTSDGHGGTFWAVPSSLGGIPAFNTVVADNYRIPATAPSNTLYLSTTQGMGSFVDSTKNLITFYSKGFTQIDISGGNTIQSYSNSVVSPTLNLVGRNGIRISSDPLTQRIFIDNQVTAISTGIYGYSKFNVISNASTLKLDAIDNSNNLFITAQSTSSILNFVGVGDILLNANSASNALFMTISTFDSQEYLKISTVAHQTYASTLSTVSSLFCPLSTLIQTNSTISSVFALSLLSTSAGIDVRQTFNENNLMNNYTEINLLKLLSSSVQQYIDSNIVTFGQINCNVASIFTSSLNTTTFIGNVTGTASDANKTLTVSPINFRLDSMSSMMTNPSQIKVTYSPSLLYNLTIGQNELLMVSTSVTACNSIIDEGGFVRPLQIYTGLPSYIYSDTMSFVFNSQNITNALTSSFSINHYIHFNLNNTANTNMSNLTSGTNALIVSLT